MDDQQTSGQTRLEHQIIDLARSLGFTVAGITNAEPTRHEQAVHNWINTGSHGEMQYMARHIDVRLDPRKLLDGAQAVICVADYYHPVHKNRPGDDSSRTPTARIARYAHGRDYHKTVKSRLHQIADFLKQREPDHQFQCCTDTAPILEREHAARSGLGWIGKNTMLIHPEYGSWSVLGTIVTTLPLKPSDTDSYPGNTVAPTDRCGNCTRCIDACPTGCISPYQIDARRCISYLTLEHRGTIDPDMHKPIGNWLAGCDICQTVCPYNNDDRRTQPQVHPDYEARVTKLDLIDILNWTQQDRQVRLQGSAAKRVKLDMFKRNALIAAGNYLRSKQNEALTQAIERIGNDDTESSIVRTTAEQIRRK